MSYAEVCVNSPLARRRTFSYSIPSRFSLAIGQAVWVPFGNQILQGIVLELTSVPAVAETREITGIIDSVPLLTQIQVNLARWLSHAYCSGLFEAVSLMLPPGFWRRVITSLKRNDITSEVLSSLTPEKKMVLEAIPYPEGSITLQDLQKVLNQKQLKKIIPQMVNQNLISKFIWLEGPRVKPKTVSYFRLKVDMDIASQALVKMSNRAVQQTALLKFFMEHSGLYTISDLKKLTGVTNQTVKALLDKGLIEEQQFQVRRDPLVALKTTPDAALTLTPAQVSAWQAITAGLPGETVRLSRREVFLLHGVTGSGKTEIYLQALQETIKRGKKGIVLVPEIAMTPQIMERLVSRFPGKVAVLHSELSLGERFDAWWSIKRGEFDVVVGPRSALFAPQPDLGLIIVDEEHEWSYKQDTSPRYHAREVALKLAELTSAAVVLGSATPDMESYYRALKGEYHLLSLRERVTSGGKALLPQVEIVDLRKELKAGNLSLFSRSLYKSVEKALKNQEQVILFLNRRGTASFIECRNCGLVIRCKYCELPLSYHFSEGILLCHQCNFHIEVPQICPHCGSRRIKYLGAGTEKLEEETARFFPSARIMRWDSDVVHRNGQAHRQLFESFRSGKADILIGTQIIAKGLDLPAVTLVGVISADIALNLPDFRAGERAFQILSQVAGRAGRGLSGGKAIIQTYSPEHYAIQAAAKHDYQAFYEKEISFRRQLHNPPFSRLARLVFTHSNDKRCQEVAEKIRQVLLREKDIQGLADFSLIGPAPAFLHRLRDQFRWQIIVRCPDPAAFLSEIPLAKGWTIDIDPVGLS